MDDRADYARDMLTGPIERVVERRPRIALPSDAEMQVCLREVLEELADLEEESEAIRLDVQNSLLICPNCGMEAPGTNKFCTGCGTKLVENEGFVCSGCGAVHKSKMNFCTKCGSKM